MFDCWRKILCRLFRLLVGGGTRLAKIDELYIAKAAVERCVIHDPYDRV